LSKLIPIGCDRTDPTAGSIGGMKIAAGDADQSQSIGLSAKPPAQTSRKAGAVDFDRAQAPLLESTQGCFPQAGGWVRQSGNSSGRVDQRNGMRCFQANLVDAAGTTITQVSQESVSHVFYLASSGQVFGHVAPAEDGAGKCSFEGVLCNREAQGPKPGRHGTEALCPAGAELCHGFTQWRIIVTDKVSKNVQLAALEFAGELDTCDQLNTPPCRFGARHPKGGDRIVVGDGQGTQPHASGGDHDLARRADSVGIRGVNVQIRSTVSWPMPGREGHGAGLIRLG
jgi:hypothetical protein